jgi:hypothetical protein
MKDRTTWRVLLLLAAVGFLAGCSAAPSAPEAPGGCLSSADDAGPGDVVCYSGTLEEPLEITVGGTEGAPVVYSGGGSTVVPGIRVEADNVVVQGFVSSGADSTGIVAQGDNVVVQDNKITQVRHTDEDVDAMRFFGNGIQLLRNHVYDLEANDVGESHVDCIQTFATSGPGSSDIRIEGNRCEGIRAQCLMAEGPDDDGGSGRGESRNWVFAGNYCDAYAEAQSVGLEDIQDVVIENNDMVGEANKAFALGKDSTGVVVRGNRIGPGYDREVEFDSPSAAEGYQGPPAD